MTTKQAPSGTVSEERTRRIKIGEWWKIPPSRTIELQRMGIPSLDSEDPATML